jgi:hypothetical protein
MGKLKNLVNKLMGLNRLYGLLFVSLVMLDSVFGDDLKEPAYCYAMDIVSTFLALSFWSNNVVIALIRFVTSITNVLLSGTSSSNTRLRPTTGSRRIGRWKSSSRS